MIESIFAISKQVEHKGKKIQIKQVSLGDIPFVTKVLSALFKKGSLQQNAISLIQSDFEAVVDVISRLTDLSKDDLSKMALDSAVFVLSEVAKENADFLQQKVAPQIEAMSAAINGLLKSKG